MRQHPVYAYKLLSPIADLRLALDIPYCHHEKWMDRVPACKGRKSPWLPVFSRSWMFGMPCAPTGITVLPGPRIRRLSIY